nr:hypothetical protein Iba_chr12eCG11300 [Ipomoea batatas]
MELALSLEKLVNQKLLNLHAVGKSSADQNVFLDLSLPPSVFRLIMAQLVNPTIRSDLPQGLRLSDLSH